MTFELVVNDGQIDSPPSSVSINVLNRIPIASAGAPQSVNKGQSVTLDGSASTDPDGDSIAYAWTQTGGTSVTLADEATATPSFTAPSMSGDLRFVLEVTDSDSGVAESIVIVTVVNQRPIAVAGPDMTAPKVGEVVLDGAASYDPDQDPLTFSWTQLSGIPVSLQNKTSPHPSFFPINISGTVVFSLVVDDGDDASMAQTVSISILSNTPPTANAGVDASVNGGEDVLLDGTASSDPDGDRLHYSWRQVSGPAATLSNPYSANPEFSAPNSAGTLTFELTISDGMGASADTVQVTTVPYSGQRATLSEFAFPTLSQRDLVNALAVALAGDTLFAITRTAIGSNEFKIVSYDMSAPLDPVVLGESLLPGVAPGGSTMSMEVYGNTIYFTTDLCDQMWRIDISDVSNPVLLGIWDQSPCPSGLFISESGIMYLADYNNGLQIFDVADRDQIIALGTYTPPPVPLLNGYTYPAHYRDVDVIGTLAYITGPGIIQIVDVSDVGDPKLVGDVFNNRSHQYTITTNGIIAITTDMTGYPPAWGLLVYDVQDPSNPQLITEIGTIGSVMWGKLVGNILYAADWGQGIYVFDLTYPSSPELIGLYSPRYAWQPVESNGFLYIPNSTAGLVVVDARSPAIPSPAASLRTPGAMDAGSLAVAGSVLYAPDGNAGLQVMDIQMPAKIENIGYVATGSYPVSATVADQFAYVGGIGTFEILDIKNPQVPRLVGSVQNLNPYAPIWRSKVVGNVAYLARGSDVASGLMTIDLTDKSNPVELGRFDTITTRGVDVFGDFAYLAIQNWGMQIVNVQDPASPALVSEVKECCVQDVAVRYPHAFLSKGNGWIVAYDISDPAAPVEVSRYSTRKADGHVGFPLSISIAGSKAYVANGDYSVQVLDISNPSSIRLAGRHFVWGSAYGTAPNGDYLYISDHDPADPDLLVAQQRPIFANRYVQADAGTSIVYLASWSHTELPDAMHAGCSVTGGSCTVDVVDQQLGVATIVWQLPENPGDYEIEIAVGTQHHWASDFDRVQVK